MDVKGLDLNQIGTKLEKYVTDYFKNSKILNLGECLFAESYMFDFEEVKHLIPTDYHHLFDDSHKFNGASGFVELESAQTDKEYIIILLSDKEYSKAYLLCMQEVNNIANEAKTTILADFVCS